MSGQTGTAENTPLRDDRGKLSDRLATEFVRRILSGELEPGGRFPTEAEISDSFGVSRSVVRDAVRTLSALRLVRVRQGQGMKVEEPDPTAFGGALVIMLMRSDLTMGQVMDARGALENQIAQLAAVRGNQNDWDRLRAELERFSSAVDEKRWPEAEAAHLAFHSRIIHATKLPALEMMLDPVQQVIMLSSVPPRSGSAELWDVWAHEPILDALVSADPDGVSNAMNAHFRALTRSEYQDLRSTPFRECPAPQQMVGDIVRQS